MRVVTHNPPRVVTPISPCDMSVINKKAHGRKCWLCLWISSLFSRSRRGGNPGLKFYRRASNRHKKDGEKNRSADKSGQHKTANP